MSTEIDRQSQRRGKRESSLTDHMDATDFFPPGTGWNKDAAKAPAPQRQDAHRSPQSTIEPRQH